MKIPPIATTTVGSFPRPDWLAERKRSEMIFHPEGAPLREAQDDATLLVLRDQEMIGIDVLTDGEQRRAHFIFHVLAHFDGFDVIDRRSKAIRRRTTHERMVPRVAAPIRRREPAVVDDLRFAKAHTSMPVKISVPGPVTVVDSTYNDFYKDEAAVSMDVAAALNAELKDLQAAGADLLQIDEPAMTRFPEKVAAFGSRALDRCLEGLTVPTIVHLCYGYPGGDPLQHEYGYPDVLRVLMESRIGGFSLEFARSGFDPKILRICDGRLIMFGCIDPGDSPQEPVDAVTRRVREALNYVEPERLLLAPDCGLMTISRELARAKLGVMVQAAAALRREM